MQIYADPITVNCRKVLAGLDFLDAPFERTLLHTVRGMGYVLEEREE